MRLQSLLQHTLESGINIPLRLLIFGIFSRGYRLITDLSKRLKLLSSSNLRLHSASSATSEFGMKSPLTRNSDKNCLIQLKLSYEY